MFFWCVFSFFTLGNLMLQRHDIEWLQPHDIHHEPCFVRDLFRQLTATQSVAATWLCVGIPQFVMFGHRLVERIAEPCIEDLDWTTAGR